jgi:hypothetical protein
MVLSGFFLFFSIFFDFFFVFLIFSYVGARGGEGEAEDRHTICCVWQEYRTLRKNDKFVTCVGGRTRATLEKLMKL